MPKIILVILLFLGGLANAGLAQNMVYVRNVLQKLTSPEMFGRGYISKGDSLAASYIAAQFDSMGIKPFGATYLQPFPMQINTFPGAVKLKIGRTDLKPGYDFIVGAASPTAQGKAKIEPLDTLIFTDEKAQSDFMRDNVSGKMLVYDAKFANRFGALPKHILNHIHSATALLELHDKLTHTLAPKQDTLPTFKVLRKFYDKGKNSATFEVNAKRYGRYMSQNVLGFVKGSINPDTFIVLTAHYDHLGKMGPDVYFPGANDNASGMCMLLSLASFYSRPENKPRCSIAFMAFGGEEAGLVGSRFYTEHTRFPLSRIRFLVNMDLMGTGEEGINTVNGALYTKQFKRLVELNKLYNFMPQVKSRGRAANSDHYYFSENDVPAFFIYTMGGISAYHDVYDRPETLPFTKFKELYGLLTAFIEDLQQ